MSSSRPFRAFVSYCHKDKAFAAWLQRRLEGYRLPRRLADKVAPLPGQAPGRIGPVFRDREDLSAATDLSAAVREAIAASSALVVVASPDAAKSQWVAREITLFRELHPDAPILVALAAGEPAESMPAALRTGPEPLAADFRKQGDGKRLAFLKIVAGLADLPLDSLVQRDAQRQVRRVTALTAGAVVLVLVMALLLAMALRAREEAERRRVTADATFRKLLTDVRRGLEGTGNVELMKTVNQVAIDYYRQQGDLASLPDDSLDLHARLLHAAGADDEKQNRLDDAFAKFTDAHGTTGGILAKKPNEPEAIFAHAQSEFYVGSIANRRKDRATATRYWKGYAQLAERLAKVEPGTTRSFLELGYAYGNLCDLYRGDGFDLKAAEHHCGKAITAGQAAFASGSELPLALANRYGAMGIVQFMLGRYDESLATCRRQAALIEQLVESEPRNVEYVLRRSWADICMANAWIHSNRPTEAVAALRQAQERQRSVFPARSSDWRVVETRFRTRLFLARALHDLGHPYDSDLQEASRQESLLAVFGGEYAAKAKSIRAAIWPEVGDAK
ncbi:MAG TPA: toll/interleukin-1 receptor domain-containing protein [Allosphingosinicella sp.]|nr:toll/interleukin-1 receptor domain-containing protein [Allosphingosinicella sp.]